MSKGSGSKRGRKTRSIVSSNNSFVTTTHIVDLFTTGLSALMYQKVAELGMAANRELGAIDWKIIPDHDTSILNDSMDIDPHFDEWEDIFEEENMGPDRKAVARLQTMISCAFPPPPPPFCHVTVIAL